MSPCNEEESSLHGWTVFPPPCIIFLLLTVPQLPFTQRVRTNIKKVLSSPLVYLKEFASPVYPLVSKLNDIDPLLLINVS